MFNQTLVKSLKDFISKERDLKLFRITRVATKDKAGNWNHRYLCQENALVESYFNDETLNAGDHHWTKDLGWDPRAGKEVPSSFGALYGSTGAELLIETKTCSTSQLETMLLVDETLCYQKMAQPV